MANSDFCSSVAGALGFALFRSVERQGTRLETLCGREFRIALALGSVVAATLATTCSHAQYFISGTDISPDVESTHAVATGDVDNDGDIDLVVGNWELRNRLYLNNGTADPFGSVVGSDIGTVLDRTRSIVLHDMNGDGWLDVVTGNGGYSSGPRPNRLYLNNGTAAPFWGVAGSLITTDLAATHGVAVADMNGDSLPDFVAGNSGTNRLYLNNGTSDPFLGVVGSDISADMRLTRGLALGDVNGDGAVDVVMGNAGGHAEVNRLYLNNGTSDPFFGVIGSDISSDTDSTTAIVLFDVNGDSKLDIIAANTGQPNRLYLNNGTSTPFAGVSGSDISADAVHQNGIAVADVTGDGRGDVICATNKNLPNRLYVNNGTATPFSGVTGIDIPSDDAYSVWVVADDIDGDGDKDLIFGNLFSTNRLYLNVSAPRLSFPLENRTPYTAIITSVFDHSLVTPYDETGRVFAFTGEIGDNLLNNDEGVDGYSNARNENFHLHGHYADNNGIFLYYDGHPGIDYRTVDQSALQPVLAAAPGTLRFVNDIYNTAYIEHGNDYRTYYLHLSSRVDALEDKFVSRSQKIGTTGKAGPQGTPYHLHFELRYKGLAIDPYGWQGAQGKDPYSYPVGIQQFNYWGSISEAWVVFSYQGASKLGTTLAPYTMIAEAQNHVASGGTIFIAGGSTTETVRIEKPMRLEAVGGTVTIGLSTSRSEEAQTELTGFISVPRPR